MAVGGVLAHAHITDQVQFREPGFQCPHGLLDNAVLGIGFAAASVLVVGDAEEHKLIDAGFQHFLGLVEHLVDAVAVLARHGGDFLLAVLPLHHKGGVNQGGFVHAGLPHHLPQNLAVTQTAGTMNQFHVNVPPWHTSGPARPGRPWWRRRRSWWSCRIVLPVPRSVCRCTGR